MIKTATRVCGSGLVPLLVILLACVVESGIIEQQSHAVEKRDAKDPSWNYEDKTGPLHWKTMFSKYCAGNRQSPIDINEKDVDTNEDLTEIDFDDTYDNPMKDAYIKNVGYTIKIIPEAKEPERTFTEGGFDDIYELEEIHFHWGSDSKKGSEHTINGKQYPLEMHLVHRNTNYKSLEQALMKEDGLAVLGVLFKIDDEDNDDLDPIIEKLDDVRKEGDTADLDDINIMDLLPDDKMPFYRYEGSLTTPHCNEVVTWIIFEDFVSISEKQMEQFRTVKESDAGEADEILVNNFRPTQPLNGRIVEISGENSAIATAAISIISLLIPLLMSTKLFFAQ